MTEQEINIILLCLQLQLNRLRKAKSRRNLIEAQNDIEEIEDLIQKIGSLGKNQEDVFAERKT